MYTWYWKHVTYICKGILKWDTQIVFALFSERRLYLYVIMWNKSVVSISTPTLCVLFYQNELMDDIIFMFGWTQWTENIISVRHPFMYFTTVFGQRLNTLMKLLAMRKCCWIWHKLQLLVNVTTSCQCYNFL